MTEKSQTAKDKLVGKTHARTSETTSSLARVRVRVFYPHIRPSQ